MKRRFLMIAAFMLSSAALAQLQPTTRQECTRRCTNDKASSNSTKTRHDGIMTALGEKKRTETDPDKLKQLAQDEERELERYEDEHEKKCRWICRHNPEE